jgi:hypothetical protein
MKKIDCFRYFKKRKTKTVCDLSTFPGHAIKEAIELDMSQIQ